MIFKEELIESERIYEGAILNLRRDKVTAASGTAYREIVEHNGAVAIVALTDDNEIIMERQYRYACGRAVLEIPESESSRRRLVSPHRKSSIWVTSIQVVRTQRK